MTNGIRNARAVAVFGALLLFAVPQIAQACCPEFTWWPTPDGPEGSNIEVSITQPEDEDEVEVYVGSEVSCSSEATDDDTIKPMPEPPPDLADNIASYTWTASRGSWKEKEGPDNEGPNVTWIAPDTPSASVNADWIRVTVNDQPLSPLPYEGTRDDTDDAAYVKIDVTVWDVEIEKCSSGWVPTKDGTTNITARIKPTGVTRTIRFTLESVSDEPGYCMNAGNETTTDKDLQFVQGEQTGFTVEGTQNCEATSDTEINSGTVTVHCYDYGAYGLIKAETEAKGCGSAQTAHVVGGEVERVRVPRDDDWPYNRIADSASQNDGSTLLDGGINATVTTITVNSTDGAPTQAGEGMMQIQIDQEKMSYNGMTATSFTGCNRGIIGTIAAAHADSATVRWWWYKDDAEHSPLGDGTTRGDGFTRYEEYRGFMVDGIHRRTQPDTQKDVFLCDEEGEEQHPLGNEDFDQTGLTIHMLASDGSEYSGSRVVNFKSDGGSPAHFANQKGIRMIDGNWHDQLLGYCFWVVGTPNDIDHIEIYTQRIRWWYGPRYNTSDWDPQDTDVKKYAIGHECGHGVDIEHHEAGTAADCVMHTPAPVNQHPLYLDPSQIAHTYCGNELEDCLHEFKLH